MRSKNLWQFKFFWDDAKNAKNDANILKNIFFFRCFSLFFDFFWKFIKTWVKNWVATLIIFFVNLFYFK
jgi:hypothetical protein